MKGSEGRRRAHSQFTQWSLIKIEKFGSNWLFCQFSFCNVDPRFLLGFSDCLQSHLGSANISIVAQQCPMDVLGRGGGFSRRLKSRFWRHHSFVLQSVCL